MLKILIPWVMMGMALSSLAASDDERETIFEEVTVRIQTTFGQGRCRWFNGCLIDNYCVLTSVNACYSSEGIQASRICLFKNKKSIGECFCFSVSGQTADCLALLFLDSPVDGTQKMDFVLSSVCADLIGKPVKASGYILDECLKETFCVVSGVITNVRSSDMAWKANSNQQSKGSLGAPVFVCENGGYRLCGIHKEVTEAGEAIVTRFTQQKIDWIQDILAESVSEL